MNSGRCWENNKEGSPGFPQLTASQAGVRRASSGHWESAAHPAPWAQLHLLCIYQQMAVWCFGESKDHQAAREAS